MENGGQKGVTFLWKNQNITRFFFILQLQTLPAPLAVVEGSPILLADNVAVVNLFSWDLVVYGFNQADIKGPQPILCIEEPDEASGQLFRASESIKLSHNRLMKR